VDRVRLVS